MKQGLLARRRDESGAVAILVALLTLAGHLDVRGLRHRHRHAGQPQAPSSTTLSTPPPRPVPIQPAGEAPVGRPQGRAGVRGRPRPVRDRRSRAQHRLLVHPRLPRPEERAYVVDNHRQIPSTCNPGTSAVHRRRQLQGHRPDDPLQCGPVRDSVRGAPGQQRHTADRLQHDPRLPGPGRPVRLRAGRRHPEGRHRQPHLGGVRRARAAPSRPNPMDVAIVADRTLEHESRPTCPRG